MISKARAVSYYRVGHFTPPSSSYRTNYYICHAIDNISQDSPERIAGLIIELRAPVATIGLPLSIRDARRIVAASHQAPFGNKEQPMVDDTTVRHAWELYAADSKVDNEAFRQDDIVRLCWNTGSSLS